MLPASDSLDDVVIRTLDNMAEMAGHTLGPGGRQVLIERAEIGMKPIITKDGVTVIRNLGYQDSIQQLILEAARDAAGRTAIDAGDGTTTATILSAAITRHVNHIIKTNSKLSPQRIVRELQKLMPFIEQKVKSHSIDANNESILRRVAILSGNGDEALADAVIEAFNVVGDEGNMTIVERGDGTEGSQYKVERIHGYTVETGHEESCRNFSNGFVNDRGGTAVKMDKPIIVLYDGIINDLSQITTGIDVLANYARENNQPIAIALVAHGFNDSVLGSLHFNWNNGKSDVKLYPVATEQNGLRNHSTQTLYDMQAYTGCPVFNPIDRPFADVNAESIYRNNKVISFEASRFKTSIVAKEDLEAIQMRVDELKAQLSKAESEYEKRVIPVRIGKLTSGIARLNIYGSSQGETREKRDRAEDAWMAIRGAIKSGACPGGGFVLVKLSSELLGMSTSTAYGNVARLAMLALSDALLEPVRAIYKNYGYNAADTELQLVSMLKNENEAFDISEEKWVPKHELLDSVPAVVEAIRNSLSIASLLGTIGGVIAFGRNTEEDAKEAHAIRKYEMAVGDRGSVN